MGACGYFNFVEDENAICLHFLSSELDRGIFF